MLLVYILEVVLYRIRQIELMIGDVGGGLATTGLNDGYATVAMMEGRHHGGDGEEVLDREVFSVRGKERH